MNVGVCAVCDRSLRTEEAVGFGVGGWFVGNGKIQNVFGSS